MTVYIYSCALKGGWDMKEIGFTKLLPTNPDSVWLKPEWFTEEKRTAIKETLLKEASEQFKRPSEVVSQIIDGFMFGSPLNPLSLEPLPDFYDTTPRAFVCHNNKNYFYHEKESYAVVQFIKNKISAYVNEVDIAFKKEAAERDYQASVSDVYSQVRTNPNFLTAYTKARKQFFPYKGSRDFLEENYAFCTEPKTELINKIQAGQFKFMGVEKFDPVSDKAETLHLTLRLKPRA